MTPEQREKLWEQWHEASRIANTTYPQQEGISPDEGQRRREIKSAAIAERNRLGGILSGSAKYEVNP